MKKIIFMFVICVSYCLTYSQKKTQGFPHCKISLTTNNNEYSLGEPIWVTVEYYNGSDSVWHLYRPDSSFYNSMSYRNTLWRTKERWNGYAFNKSMFINDNPNCAECGFAIPLTGGFINIKPKHKYSFTTELMEGQKDHAWILPGKYLLNYYDGYEAIKSDTIEICLKFTENSVNLLLKRLLDEKESRSNIKWIIQLLSDIYPEIKNYKFRYENHIISYSEEQSVYNSKLLDEFKLYWKQNKDTKILQAKIHAINIDLRKYSSIDNQGIKQVSKDCNYD